FLRSDVIQSQPQKIAQSSGHFLRRVSVFKLQSRNRVERVEQKMWMELRLQRLQLRLGQLRLELRSLQFAFFVLLVILQRVRYGDGHSVNDRAEQEVKNQNKESAGQISGQILCTKERNVSN